MDKYEKQFLKLIKDMVGDSNKRKKLVSSPIDKEEEMLEEYIEHKEQVKTELENSINKVDDEICNLCNQEKTTEDKDKENLYVSLLNTCKLKISLLKEFKEVDFIFSHEEFEIITKQIASTYNLAVDYANKLLNCRKESVDVVREKKDQLHLLLAEYYYSCQTSMKVHQQIRKNDSYVRYGEIRPEALQYSLYYSGKVIDILSKIEKPIEKPILNINLLGVLYSPCVKRLSELKNLHYEGNRIIRTDIQNDKIIDKKINLKTGEEIILFMTDMVQSLKYESLLDSVEVLIKLGKKKEAKKFFDKAKSVPKNYTDIIEHRKDFESFMKVYRPQSDYCFIATAVYNSSFAEEVVFLKEFRDNYLKNNRVGNIFISIYYRIGLLITDWISNKQMIKKICRSILNYIVKILRLFYKSGIQKEF